MLGQAIPSGGSYFEDTQVVPVGPTTIRVTRRFMPQWAIICGIIGLFLCLIGIAAFFFRDTEELTIDIQPDGEGGSRVAVNGKAKGIFVTTIQSTLARFDGYSETSIASPSAGAPAAGTPAQGTLSDDGKWQWDGQSWQPVPTPPSPAPEPGGSEGQAGS